MFNWFQKAVNPDWEWYAEQFTNPATKNDAIQEQHFYVLDIELTGLDPIKDRILSMCCVPVYRNQILLSKAFSCEVRQDIYKGESAGIHELLPKSAGKLSEQKALENLLKHIGTGVLVAHFATVEKQFLSEALKRNAQCKLKNLVVDTASLLGRVTEKYANKDLLTSEDWQLEHVCNHFSIQLEDAHTACGDAVATALLFVKLLQLLDKRGVTKLKKLT